MEDDITSLMDWVSQRLLALHEQANGRNLWVQEKVGEMVAGMGERTRLLETQLKRNRILEDTNHQLRADRRAGRRSPPPAAVVHDVDGMDIETAGPSAAPAVVSQASPPMALVSSSPVHMAVDEAAPVIQGDTAGSTNRPSSEADQMSVEESAAPVELVPATPAAAPPTPSPPPVAESSPLSSPSPTARPTQETAATPTRSATEPGSGAEEQGETEEDTDQPRRSLRQRSAAPVDIVGPMTPRRGAERRGSGKGGPKKPRAG